MNAAWRTGAGLAGIGWDGATAAGTGMKRAGAALDEMKQRQAESRGDVFRSTLTPYEKYISDVASLGRMGLSADTFSSASNAARKEMEGSFNQLPGMSFPGGATKGSAEAYTAIIRAMGQDRAKQQALDYQRQQLEEAKKSSRSLAVIEAGLKGGEAVNLDNL
jgi:hypothetical protein